MQSLQRQFNYAAFSADNTQIVAGEGALVLPERPEVIVRPLAGELHNQTVLLNHAPFNINTITHEQILFLWLLKKHTHADSITLQEIAKKESLDLDELKKTFSSFDKPTQKTLMSAYVITDAPGFIAKNAQKPNNKARIALVVLCSLATYTLYKTLTLRNK